MLATDAGETTGTHNLRPQPTSPEDNVCIDAGHESLNQYNDIIHKIPLMHYTFNTYDVRQEISLIFQEKKLTEN